MAINSNYITTERYFDAVKERGKYNAYGDFLDSFYYSLDRADRIKVIEKPPTREEDYPIIAAKLAATVERLCHLYDLAIPAWCMEEKYELPEPYFGDPYPKIAEYRQLLIDESPPEFAKRNIFLGGNCMDRA